MYLRTFVSIVELLWAIILCQLAGIIGSFFTIQNIENWYQTLEKPFFAPPNWIFGPVWIMLYTLMGVSLYLLWRNRKTKPGAIRAMVVFLIHLVLNALWSILFFGFHSPLAAFIDLLLLIGMIVYMLITFRKIQVWASYLLIPYLIWVSFAGILNLAIVVLN